MSQSNLGGAGLPTTIPFDQAFRAALASIADTRHPLLADVDGSDKSEWDAWFDPDEVRRVLSCCITDTLEALGIPEPPGDDLGWLGPLHDLVLETRPNLAAYLEATTDQGEEN